MTQGEILELVNELKSNYEKNAELLHVHYYSAIEDFKYLLGKKFIQEEAITIEEDQ